MNSYLISSKYMVLYLSFFLFYYSLDLVFPRNYLTILYGLITYDMFRSSLERTFKSNSSCLFIKGILSSLSFHYRFILSRMLPSLIQKVRYVIYSKSSVFSVFVNNLVLTRWIYFSISSYIFHILLINLSYLLH